MRLTEFTWGASIFPRDVLEVQRKLIGALGGGIADQHPHLLEYMLQLKIMEAESNSDYFVAVNSGEHDFRLEIRSELLGYSHQSQAPQDMTKHITEFAHPLIEALTAVNDEEIDRPLDLRRGVKTFMYRFSTKLDSSRRKPLKNRAGLCELIPTLSQQGLPELGLHGALGRVDLKLSLCQDKVVLAGQTLDLEIWVDLRAPANDDYRFLELTLAMQTPSGRLPQPAHGRLTLDLYRYCSQLSEPFLKQLGYKQA